MTLTKSKLAHQLDGDHHSSPLRKIVANLVDTLATKARWGETQKATIAELLSLDSDVENVSESVSRFNGVLKRVIQKLQAAQEQGESNKLQEYEELLDETNEFLYQMIERDPSLRLYVEKLWLSDEQYATYKEGQSFYESMVQSEETLETLEQQKNALQTEINTMNNPSWVTNQLKKYLEDAATKISNKADGLMDSKKFGSNKKFADIAKKHQEKNKEEANGLYKLASNIKTEMRLVAGELPTIKAKYEGKTDEVSQVFLQAIELTEKDLLERESKVKQLSDQLWQVDVHIEKTNLAKENDEKSVEANLEEYTEVEILANENKYAFVERFLEVFQEKLQQGDANTLDIVRRLGTMDIEIKEATQREWFDDKDFSSDVKGLYGKLQSFTNDFVYPTWSKNPKRKGPDYIYETKKKKGLAKAINWITSTASGASAWWGLMEMIPPIVGDVNGFKSVKDFFTRTWWDINETKVFAAWFATLVVILLAMQKSKSAYILQPAERVGKQSINPSSTFGRYASEIAKKGKRLGLVGFIGLAGLVVYLDASGISSLLFWGYKKKAEAAKVEKAVWNMEKEVGNTIKYVDFVDSLAQVGIEQAIDQELQGTAATAAAGAGPFYGAKVLAAYGEDDPRFASLTPAYQTKARQILASAGGNFGQYESIHDSLSLAQEEIRDAMVVKTADGIIEWSEINEKVQDYTWGLNLRSSMQLKDFAGQISQSMSDLTQIMNDKSTNYNTKMIALKGVFDNIENIAKSGKKLDITLIDDVALKSKISAIEVASKKASEAVGSIDPYVTWDKINEVLREDAWFNQVQMVLANLAIGLASLLITLVLFIWAAISLRVNKKDQQAELANEFNDLNAQQAEFINAFTQNLPSFIHTGAVDDLEKIFHDGGLGQSKQFYDLIGKVLNQPVTGEDGEAIFQKLTSKDDADQKALVSWIVDNFVAHVNTHMDDILMDNEDLINEEMEASSLVLTDEDWDNLSYVEHYFSLKDQTERSRRHYINAFITGSKTFRDAVLTGFNAMLATGVVGK